MDLFYESALLSPSDYRLFASYAPTVFRDVLSNLFVNRQSYSPANIFLAARCRGQITQALNVGPTTSGK